MAAEDWGFEDYDYEDGFRIVCRRCEAEGLAWEEARGERNEKRWVLIESDGSVHCCPQTADADEFPLITENQNANCESNRSDSNRAQGRVRASEQQKQRRVR